VTSASVRTRPSHVRPKPSWLAGPRQIRIAVRAASVNRIDREMITGAMSGGQPMVGHVYLGYDAAGVVDEVGDEVTDVSVVADVLGRGHTNGIVRAMSTAGRKNAPHRDRPPPYVRVTGICDKALSASPTVSWHGSHRAHRLVWIEAEGTDPGRVNGTGRPHHLSSTHQPGYF
jgi:NADPH:quinone reductase-like Zn-dependent oxidoreductase